MTILSMPDAPPEEIWADACDGLDLAEADDGVDRWWVSRSPSPRFCTAYRRADTVVGRDVAKKMADALRHFTDAGHDPRSWVKGQAARALAAYEEATGEG